MINIKSFILIFGSVLLLTSCQNNSEPHLPESDPLNNISSMSNDPKLWAPLREGDEMGQYYREGDKIFWKAKVDYEILGVDLDSFLINEAYSAYAKDNHKVYYFGLPLEVDLASFELIDEDHHKDKNGVYLGGHQLPGADAPSFEVMDYKQTYWKFYSKDKNQVYYQWNVIETADPDTFEILGNGYGKDEQSVFETYTKIPEADPKTFAPISEAQNYYKDKMNVYWRGKILQNSHPETFKILQEDKYYGVDDESVYFYNKKLPEADPDSFKILERGYSKDKSFAFYEDKKIKGADPDSFKVTESFNPSAKDKNFTYSYEKKVN